MDFSAGTGNVYFNISFVFFAVYFLWKMLVLLKKVTNNFKCIKCLIKSVTTRSHDLNKITSICLNIFHYCLERNVQTSFGSLI